MQKRNPSQEQVKAQLYNEPSGASKHRRASSQGLVIGQHRSNIIGLWTAHIAGHRLIHEQIPTRSVSRPYPQRVADLMCDAR